MFPKLLKLSKRRQIYYSEFKTNRGWGYLDPLERRKDKEKILSYKTLICYQSEVQTLNSGTIRPGVGEK